MTLIPLLTRILHIIMSDIAVRLLEAIDAKLTTETASGEALEDIGSFFVMFTASDMPPDYGTILPLLLVRMGQVTSETISNCGRYMLKQYPVTFSVFTEDSGDKEDQTAANILDLLETAFFGQKFSLSQWCDVTSKNYQQASIKPLSGQWTGSSELVITHVNTDVRSLTS